MEKGFNIFTLPFFIIISHHLKLSIFKQCKLLIVYINILPMEDQMVEDIYHFTLLKMKERWIMVDTRRICDIYYESLIFYNRELQT